MTKHLGHWVKTTHWQISGKRSVKPEAQMTRSYHCLPRDVNNRRRRCGRGHRRRIRRHIWFWGRCTRCGFCGRRRGVGFRYNTRGRWWCRIRKSAARWSCIDALSRLPQWHTVKDKVICRWDILLLNFEPWNLVAALTNPHSRRSWYVKKAEGNDI